MKHLVVFIFIIPQLLKVNGFILNYKRLNLTVELDDDPHIQYLPFEQLLDHFDDNEDSVFTQRSWSNDEFFDRDDSPIFLYVDGENPSHPDGLKYNSWHMWAEKYRAKLYILEHRFFGESKPTADLSIENLQYLTTEQALADVAYYIQETNKKNGYTDKNKWILFGGSYPGALVAWARLHYPDVVHGAVSSSAPLQAKASFSEFHDVVRASLDYFVPGCSDVVHQMAKDVKKKMATDSGFKDFFSKYGLCTDEFDINNWLDQAHLWDSIAGVLGSLTQMYSPDSDEMNIDEVCKKYLMNETLGDPTDRFSAYKNKDGPNPCDNSEYKNINDVEKDTSWATNEGGDRQWMYLMCNELGYFATSITEDSLYGDTIPLKYFAQKCIDVFGEKYNEQYIKEAVDSTNAVNQGTDIEVTNVVFVQGNIDPWHALGEVKNPTDDDPYVLINGTSHCADIYDPNDGDNDSLKAARELIDQYLNKWLTVE